MTGRWFYFTIDNGSDSCLHVVTSASTARHRTQIYLYNLHITVDGKISRLHCSIGGNFPRPNKNELFIASKVDKFFRVSKNSKYSFRRKIDRSFEASNIQKYNRKASCCKIVHYEASSPMTFWGCYQNQNQIFKSHFTI